MNNLSLTENHRRGPCRGKNAKGWLLLGPPCNSGLHRNNLIVAPVASSGSVFKLTLQSGAHVLTCAEGGKCSIGDMGPGGGTVFYVSTGFTATGTACNTSCRYLEAAPVSGTNAWVDSSTTWSATTNVSVGVTSLLIGFGKSSTDLMYAQNSSAGYPAALSIGYRGPNNYSDWFIPSVNEFAEMFKVKNILSFKPVTGGTNTQARYWTSTENSSTRANDYSTKDGGNQAINKNTPLDPGFTPVYSRAIRAF